MGRRSAKHESGLTRCIKDKITLKQNCDENNNNQFLNAKKNI